MKAINLSKTFEFVWDEDEFKGTSKETKFKFTGVDSRVFTQINDLFRLSAYEADAKIVIEDRVFRYEAEEPGYDLVGFGLKSVSNFLDEDDNEIPINFITKYVGSKAYQVVDPEFLNLIPRGCIMALAGKIFEVSTNTETERKN